MRKMLLGFIMLLMLTPILTCAMAFCPLESAQAATPKSCHQNDETQKKGPMLALDCMGVDLFQPNLQADIVQSDLSVDHIDFVWADVTSHYDFLLTADYFIRSPPFDVSPPHFNNHDLYLTTQRLRI